MKLSILRSIMLLTVISVCVFSSHSQSQSPWKSYKYGKVSKQELEMQSYANDTSAAAVVLFSNGYTSYQFIVDDFRVVTEVTKRIKILKNEGVDKATVTLRLSCNKSNCETYEKLEAIAYNLVDGKIEQSKLEKKYIFEEKASDYFRLIKFAIPNARAGTVIEYRYTISSPFYYDLPTWNFQSDIPVQYTKYEVLIPEYFEYNIEQKGYESISVNEIAENQIFNVRTQNGSSTQPLSCTARNIVYSLENIPAMKGDDHIWYVQDFMSGLRFELLGTRFPNSFYKTYTQTWEHVDKTIRDNTEFNSYISRNNPYKKEITALISSLVDEKSKIEAICQFIKEKIVWNESYAFLSSPTEAIKSGKGNNAQINAVLLSAFKEVGIKAYPVLISRRSRGRLPVSFPSLDQLNTFVVMAVDGDGNKYFMDGSAQYGGLNMLPTDLLVDKARIYNNDIEDKWIDLTGIGRNTTVNLVSARIEPDGSVNGTYTSLYSCQTALRIKNIVAGIKDSLEYVQGLGTELKAEINSLEYEGVKSLMSAQVKREIKFTRKSEGTSEYIYFNPLIFSHLTKNDFIQSDRKLPVEFNYPYSYRITSSVRLPQNYKVEEMPKSGRMTLFDKSGLFTYYIKQSEGLIEISYRFDLNQIIFPFTDYKLLQEFFAEVVSKNNALVVLKKI